MMVKAGSKDLPAASRESHRSSHEEGELSGRFISPTSKEAARLSQRAGAPSHQWSRPVIGKIGPASPPKKKKKAGRVP